MDDVRAGRLRRALDDFAPPSEAIHPVYPTRRHLPPRVRVVIDYLAEGVRLMNAHLAGTQDDVPAARVEAAAGGETEAVLAATPAPGLPVSCYPNMLTVRCVNMWTVRCVNTLTV